MDRSGKIIVGVLSGFGVAILVIIFAYQEHLFVNPANNLAWIIVLLEIPIAFGVTSVFWYMITAQDRRNRNYVRNKIMRNYSRCLAIAKALKDDPTERANMDRHRDSMVLIYEGNIRLMETHSHLLGAEEIEICRREHLAITAILLEPLSRDPNDDIMLARLVAFLDSVMNQYGMRYGISR